MKESLRKSHLYCENEFHFEGKFEQKLKNKKKKAPEKNRRISFFINRGFEPQKFSIFNFIKFNTLSKH